MQFRLGLRKIVAGPGETVVVPAGARHKFANGGDTHRPRARRGRARPGHAAAPRHHRRARPRGRTSCAPACPSRCTSPSSSSASSARSAPPSRPPGWCACPCPRWPPSPAAAATPTATPRPSPDPAYRGLTPVYKAAALRMGRVIRTAVVSASACVLFAAPSAHGAGYTTLFDGRSRRRAGATPAARGSRSATGTLRTAPGNGSRRPLLRPRALPGLRPAPALPRRRGRQQRRAPALPEARRRPLLVDRLRATRCRSTTPPRDPRRTGSIYGFADLDAARARVKPAGTWSTLTIRVEGQTLHGLPRRPAHQPLHGLTPAAAATSACRRTAALRTSSRSGPSGSASSEPAPRGSDRRSSARRRRARSAPRPAPHGGSRRR